MRIGHPNPAPRPLSGSSAAGISVCAQCADAYRKEKNLAACYGSGVPLIFETLFGEGGGGCRQSAAASTSIRTFIVVSRLLSMYSYAFL